ncbi:Cys-tRNA(Pro) deacylase [uncultured Cloacibacillus sp.]|uniref:Cys-tRNA(Pro) deacylase n=1 Tax=uncultured Cloacibacillus sp. TaxID=889794 RepID=UPI001F865694|nr:Cys-tRNA(Pro) deacylase [uncultured Cloacibacillus sp.]HIR18588.1 Cys-tRNA(Pro) deacylase [Candidatus Caccocola faecigallinarum]HIT03581.1 Cys-tRNA(Pro) deacylase [Candidatus Caccocola faecipullorum]
MAAVKKTNAVRQLESKKIPFELLEYEIDEELLSAEDAAAKTGIPEERTFKTLCCRGDKTGVMMVCVPAGRELDFKALAAASGNKSAELVHLKEVQGLTGYVRGGCSPLGTKKKYPVIIDDSAMTFDFITVNAGHRGLLFKLAPADLVKATEAKLAPIMR